MTGPLAVTSRQTPHLQQATDPATLYRPEVDGLRAVAVVPVILFHLGFSWIPGGYVGVDIFFVISGYLITRLVLVEIRENRFSFAVFYGRRVRRLAPAYLFAVAFTLVGALLLFSPRHTKTLGQEATFVLLNVSNLFYWKHSGYFEAESMIRPLLHTWSLAVEEQFYLVWPALLYIVHRLQPKRMVLVATLIMLGAASLIFSVNMLSKDPMAAFYLTPFRIFEFVIGALALFFPGRLRANPALGVAAMVLGLAAIAFSLTQFTRRTAFPGLNALIPCLGAFLVILPTNAPYVGRLLNNRMSVGIGLISYSLYLIHWPVIVFANYLRFDGPLSTPQKLVLVIVSFCLASLMYFLIEQPFRRQHSGARFSYAGFSLSCSVLVTALMFASVSAWGTAGWPWRVPKSVDTRAGYPGYDNCRDVYNCEVGDVRPDAPTVYVAGDSHALHLTHGFSEWGKLNGVKFLIATGPSCMILDVQMPSEFPYLAECLDMRSRFYNDIANSTAPIIIAARWRGYPSIDKIQDGIHRFLEQHQNNKVIVVGQVPQPVKDLSNCSQMPAYVLSSAHCSFYAYDQEAENYNGRLLDAAEKYENGILANPMRVLCTKNMCQARSDEHNLYVDEHHLTEFGSSLVVRGFIGPELSRILRQRQR